jgi:hypothetical protein
MKKVKVDLDTLDMAFSYHGEDLEAYLDTETGEVVLVPSEIMLRLSSEDDGDESENENEDESVPSKDVTESDSGSLVSHEDDPMYEDARRIHDDKSDRYISVVADDSSDGYTDMVDFLETVHDERIAGKLDSALRGKRPFRRFKDVLEFFPEERERWFRFRDERLRARILEWLRSEGIEVEGQS